MSSGTLSNPNRDQSVQKPRPLFHEPKTAPVESTESPTKAAVDFLESLPGSSLLQLGIHMDMSLVRSLAWTPVGCRLSLFTANWTQITSDPRVLETISGYKLKFLGCPSQKNPPGSIKLEASKAQALSQAVLDLAFKGAIAPGTGSQGSYISQIFLVAKSDGSWRLVINLKSLNWWIVPCHFKMESIRTLRMLTYQSRFTCPTRNS